MKIRIARIAYLEKEEAKKYYNIKQEGLGDRFDQKVKEAIERIKNNPLACPIERGEIRRCIIHKFPYKILYAIQENSILIIAVANKRRRPDYWIHRIFNKK